MSSCELDACEGPKFGRKCREERDADPISPKNEDAANEAAESRLKKQTWKAKVSLMEFLQLSIFFSSLSLQYCLFRKSFAGS